LSDLELLRSFLAVYRAGAINKAAEPLRLSQPAVSAHVRSLERRLGRPLFDRLSRGVAPLPAADDLARAVGPHLDALEALGDSGHADVGSFIYMGGPGELLAARVMPALARQVAGGAHLRVRLGQTGPLLDALTKAELDLVVATLRQPKRGLEFEPLYEEEFVLVANRMWAERLCGHGRSLDATLLANVPLVSYDIDLPILRRYWRVVFGEHLRTDATLVIDDLRGVLATVVAGAGVSVLPSYLCTDELARGELVQLVHPKKPPRNTIFLAWRTGSLRRAGLAAVYVELLQAAKSW